MPYQLTPTDPPVSWDAAKGERLIAQFLKANAIATDAQLDNVVDTMTATQLQNALKALLKAFIKVDPIPPAGP